jgi:succinyl-CoA synthetase alpha subunit
MIVRKNNKVVVLGITGRQGTFWTEKMLAYGTQVVAGVNPKRAGERHCNVPIFASTAEAVHESGADVAVMFIPPANAREAAVSAAEAGIKLLVVLTEHIPAQDCMRMHAVAARHGTRIIGPNTSGLVTPGECFVGIMPAFVPSVFKTGPVGVISRSGSLGTLVCLKLTQSGIGQSAFIGIGGDPMLGTTTREALQALDRDSKTEAVVIVGEIGGTMEEDAAEYAKTMRKPVAAFIAGAASPPGKKMGHAGAIVIGNRGSYASKRKALEAAGVIVADTPAQIAQALFVHS